MIEYGRPIAKQNYTRSKADMADAFGIKEVVIRPLNKNQRKENQNGPIL